MHTHTPFVLALEPDHRQASVLKRVIRDRVHAELMVVDSRDAAIAATSARVPDVILLTALLSPRDEQELIAHLRGLAGAEHVQTHTIPQLASSAQDSDAGQETGGLFGKLRRKKATETIPGCDPAAFADEVGTFIARAQEMKAHAALAPPPLIEQPVRDGATAHHGRADGTHHPHAADPEREEPAIDGGSAWASPFEWRRPDPAAQKKEPAPRTPLVTNAPLAVVAEEEETRRAEAERRATEQAERERLAAEAVQRERERLEAEAAQRAREEAERRAQEEAERRAKEEAVRRAKAEAELRAKEEAERRAKEEAERRAKEEAERRAKAEAELRAKEEAERRAKAEAERRAKEEAERRAKEEAERRAKAEAERRAKEEAAKRERERLEAERRAKEEAERRAQEEAARRAREEAERRAREEAERLEAEAAAERERVRLAAEAAEQERLRAEAEARLRAEAEDDAEIEIDLDHDPFADFRGDEARESPLLKLMPVTAWARTDDRKRPPSAPSGTTDEFNGLISGLLIPSHVAAVTYPRGCRIRRVRVPAPRPAARSRIPRPVILSKRALQEARNDQQSGA